MENPAPKPAEESKSIWRKSWKGPRAFFVWLALALLLAFGAFAAIFCVEFLSNKTITNCLLVALISSLCLTLFFALGIALLRNPNEESKSILRKPWRGVRGFFLWFISLAAVAFVLIFYIGRAVDDLVPALIISLSLGLLLALCIAFVRWLCCWRNARRFLIGVACLITLFALFHLEENWRGKSAWQKYKREQEAKGEKFDVLAVAPPLVPDDQNFATTPIVATTYAAEFDRAGHRHPYDSNVVNRLNISTEILWDKVENKAHADWRKAKKTEFNLWQEYYQQLAAITNYFPAPAQPQSPAADILLALSRYDSVVEELRYASQLPFSRFPIGYTDENPAEVLLPHLAGLKQPDHVLELRASAELELGQSEKALDDIKLMLRLNDSVRTEPFIISHLVRIAIFHIAMQPIWEGLADHRWSDAQLVALEAELRKLDFLADYHFSMRGERALGVGGIEFFSHGRDTRFMHMSEDGSAASGFDWEEEIGKVIFPLIPSGWFAQNKMAMCRMHDDYLFPAIDLQARTVSPTAVRHADEATGNIRVTPYNLFTKMLLPALTKSSQKFARAQSATDLARVALALERFRLAQPEPARYSGVVHPRLDQYPETLDVLAPRFIDKLPHDIIGGQPLKYRRTDDGQFILYSIGWNEKDDGGIVVLKKTTDGKEGAMNAEEGDWVWKYPAKN